jgi:para-nitrobenzyl esterase
VQAYRNRLHVTGEGSLTAVRTAFLTDAVYRFPATRLADSHTRAGGRAYRYLFSAQPFGATMGAFHAVDLAYLFDKLSTPALDTAENRSAQHALYTAWSRFAATGDPGWPPYRTAEVNNVRQIGAEPSSCDDPPQDEAGSLWRSKLAGSADSAEVH